MKTKRREIVVLAVLLVLQIALHIVCGANKEYLHMDEAYSYGLSTYHRVEIIENEDFYNTWHEGDYYADYIILDEDEAYDFSNVYENQKNDVHPPLYYFLLRIAMSFSVGEFSIWCGVALNIIIYVFITLFAYLILKRVFEGQPLQKEKSAVVAFLASQTMASLTSVTYIRMYALVSLLILVSNYLHIRMSEDGLKPKWLVLIALVAVLGSLSHYYYLFYLAMLALYQIFRFYRRDEYKSIFKYFLSLVLAGCASLLIFPYSLEHMFFGYQGQGFISKLSNVPKFMSNATDYLWKLNQEGFNLLLLVIAVVAAFVVYYRKDHRERFVHYEKPERQTDENIKSILFPSVFYFLIVSVASPWVEIRYIIPICVPAFILVIYYFHRLIKSGLGEDRGTVVVAAILAVMFVIMPVKYNLKPEFLYPERAEIMERIENDYNAPAIYYQNMADNRFLDDILIFSKLEKSYIAPDPKITEENISNILDGIDVSGGLVVFINSWQDNDKILEITKNVGGLENVEWIGRLNVCDVYYIS